LDLKEYLFYDLNRLTSYYQQVNNRGVVTEAIPIWKGALSLLGPTGEVTRQTVRRAPTPHEMIVALGKYLSDNALVVLGRDVFAGQMFARDTFLAKKVILFPSEDALPGRKSLGLWISEKMAIPRPSKNLRKTRIYLIEDCWEPDSKDALGLSGFGALRFLMSLEFTRTVLAEPLGVPELRNQRGSELKLYEEALDSQDHSIVHQFERDPIGFLEARGAHVGDERTIEALYRKRFSAYGYETRMFDEDALVGLEFGYPVYIAPLWGRKSSFPHSPRTHWRGRRPELTPHQKREAIERRERGEETLAEIGRSYKRERLDDFEAHGVSSMDWKTILTPAIIVAAVVSGLVSLLVALLNAYVSRRGSERLIQVEDITKERQKWRDKLRAKAIEVQEAVSSRNTEKLEALQLEFSLNLNPIDTEDREILVVIRRLITANSDQTVLEEFSDRLALLLKYDWDRAKHEARPRSFYQPPPIRIPYADFEQRRDRLRSTEPKSAA
jgi:hypothetical protein